MNQHDSKQRVPDDDYCENQSNFILEEFKKKLINVVLTPVNELFERLLTTSSPSKVSIATYADMIAYFVDKRPKDSSIEKGTILRQYTNQGILLTQLFLNADNQPVLKRDGSAYGRKILANSLDKDLVEAFGDKSVIIFE